ncbi:MAG: NYN domain-containing protein [Parcubacteria group bacterium]
MSVIKHKAQRVGIFIDTQNIYHSAKNLYHAKANFGAIVKEILGARVLVRAIAYVATTESGEENAFFGALSKVGIETRTKPLQIFIGGAKKANWDIDMAMDAVKLAPKLDTIILITGDGDFVSLIEYLQNTNGTQVEVASFGKSSSSKLIEAADDFLDLDENPKKYLLGGTMSMNTNSTSQATTQSNTNNRNSRRKV